MRSARIMALAALTMCAAGWVHGAQFDIATFTVPAGWSRQDGNGNVLLQTIRHVAGRETGCQIYLFGSRPSRGTPAQNFFADWEARVAGTLAVTTRPSPNQGRSTEGYDTMSASVDALVGGVPMRVLLVNATGFRKTMSFMALSSANLCDTELTTFFQNLNLETTADGGSGPPRVAPPNTRTPVEARASDVTPNAPMSDAADPEFMPVLDYTDPPNFWRGGIGGKRWVEWLANDINFSFCVYPFREYKGDAKATFRQTLLSDLIDPFYREQGIGSAPQFNANSMTGADAVIEAHFQDSVRKIHHRIAIVAGHWVAIVDIVAPTDFAWQKAFPSAAQSLKSMHVGKKPAPPSLSNGPGPSGAKLAGLFQGMGNKFTVNLDLGPGYGQAKPALRYYLLSSEGRVYRCYDFPPGGSVSAAKQFDFDAAEREDPGNTGRFAVRGNQLYMKMGGPNAEEIKTMIDDIDVLQLDGVTYVRKRGAK